MSSHKAIQLINETSSSIVDKAYNFDQIKKSIDTIHVHFQQITHISGFDEKMEHLAAVTAAKGKALGLNHAAQCLLDYNRTAKFIKAIVLSIKEKQQKHPGEVIHIFYAGCGPYAPLLTLVAPLFKEYEIQYELLEINGRSIESAKKLIHELDLENFVIKYHVNDAVTFQIPKSERFHILISETLDALLYRECYVPILFNLLPQLEPATTVIPENVEIHLSLLTHSSINPDYKELVYGSVFNVRKMLESQEKTNPLPPQLPSFTVDLTPYDTTRYSHVLLDTKVKVNDDIWIYRNESSLTIPLEMSLEQPFLFKSIVFQYHLEPEIELKCSVA